MRARGRTPIYSVRASRCYDPCNARGIQLRCEMSGVTFAAVDLQGLAYNVAVSKNYACGC